MRRLVIVGNGVRGRQWAHAVACSSGAALVAIVDATESARQRAHVPAYATLAEAVDGHRPDAVIIATPPSSHARDVLYSLDLGLPVLCEKPLTEDFEEAVALAEASRRTTVPLLVGMNFRFVAASREYRRLIQSASLGAVLFGQFTYIRNRDGRRPDLNDFPLTMRQPMLFEQSIHHLDLLRYVYGSQVLAVTAHTWNPATSVYRDDSCVTALLEFEQGLRVSYLGTWTSGSNRLAFKWRTDCADGVIVQEDQFGGLRASRRDVEAGLTAPLFDRGIEPLQDLGFPPEEPFTADTRRLLEHFLEVIDGRDSAGPTAEDHLQTIALVHACMQSARERRRIEIGSSHGR